MKVEELKKHLDKDEVLLVDVREPAEYKTECIEEACLIPLGEISLEKLPSKRMPIVVHCRSGKRSVEACAKLLGEDPALEIYSLEGGILAWQQAGFKVKKFPSK
ncbi:MAG: ygaP 2 [Gammaproteobacteria bacterium]|jgi:rhodanese-related sulfurtransferase|nr:ygaP 2 [Gammaproteobacteria bacterium]